MIKPPTACMTQEEDWGQDSLNSRYCFFVVMTAMIIGMLAFDIYAENQMKAQSHVAEPLDAADR